MADSMAPGGGGRFKALVAKLKARKGKKKTAGTPQGRPALARGGAVRNPAALAAFIGRKKYSKGRFQAMAAAGRKNA